LRQRLTVDAKALVAVSVLDPKGVSTVNVPASTPGTRNDTHPAYAAPFYVGSAISSGLTTY